MTEKRFLCIVPEMIFKHVKFFGASGERQERNPFCCLCGFEIFAGEIRIDVPGRGVAHMRCYDPDGTLAL